MEVVPPVAAESLDLVLLVELSIADAAFRVFQLSNGFYLLCADFVDDVSFVLLKLLLRTLKNNLLGQLKVKTPAETHIQYREQHHNHILDKGHHGEQDQQHHVVVGSCRLLDALLLQTRVHYEPRHKAADAQEVQRVVQNEVHAEIPLELVLEDQVDGTGDQAVDHPGHEPPVHVGGAGFCEG